MTNVLEILETSPALIASANQRVQEADTALQMAEHHLKVARAAATIKYREEKNATLIKAYVDADPAVQEKELEVIAKEAEAKIAKNRADALVNQWISARKIAGMDQSELDAIRGSTIRQ